MMPQPKTAHPIPPPLAEKDLLDVADQWQSRKEQDIYAQVFFQSYVLLVGIWFASIAMMIGHMALAVHTTAAAQGVYWVLGGLLLSTPVTWVYSKTMSWFLRRRHKKEWGEQVARFKELITAQAWDNPELKKLLDDPEQWRVLTQQQLAGITAQSHLVSDQARQEWAKLCGQLIPLRMCHKKWFEEQMEAMSTDIKQALVQEKDPAAQQQLAYRVLLNTAIDADSVLLPKISVLDTLRENQDELGENSRNKPQQQHFSSQANP